MQINGIDNTEKLTPLFHDLFFLILLIATEFQVRNLDLVKDISKLEIQEFRKELFQPSFIKSLNQEYN